ncbi:MAG: porin [Paraburkholderia sp.]|uniref:porin n=1 Tax=Paraburkholderia sp. TaxID=1926495 RepID=UPI00120FFC28|nr:porin [Paraburkholderia sp.]TAM05264.1 MAG: porin [Paraburkholderia sp.]TAM28710.1 MAG: porin [Paraburkholderia sp.]
MKNRHFRKTFLLVVLGGASGVASAQSSVTLYGTIDAGVLYQNRAATGSGSQVQLATGGIAPSIWGFRGVEDLGGGMKAIFNLEGHFSSNNGTLTSGPGFTSEIFRRQANIGLSTHWGTVTLGRMYSPSLLAAISTEPRGFAENLSNLYTWAYNQLPAPGNAEGAGTNPGNDVGVFIGNAVQYSNTLGPVWVGGAWSFGGVPGSLKNGSEMSLGATYTGPFTASAAYQSIADSVTGENVSRLWNFGVAMSYGPLTGKLNYLGVIDRSVFGPDISNVRSISPGIDYRWNYANTLTLAGYYNTYSGAHRSITRSLVLSNNFSLSKRTTLYAQVAYVDAGVVGTADPLEGLKTSIVSGGTAAGAKTVLANVGIMHHF